MIHWPRTQKAQGLVNLLRSGAMVIADGPGYFQVVPKPPDYAIGSELAALMCTEVKFPCFGRPCPRHPRHGFVESRLLRNEVDALNLLAETLREDEHGEMILMPRFTGKFSGVVNNGGVVWGHGNDGVTGAGKSGTYSIPAQCARAEWQSSVGRACTGLTAAPEIGADNCSYLEMVEHLGQVKLVQCRTGPLQSGGAEEDYIPREVKVTNVIELEDCNGNLMLWDKLIRTAKSGSVVRLPKGTTRFSHYAVHCLLNHVPIVFGAEAPEVGTVLKPNGAAALGRLGRHDYEYMAALILTSITKPAVIRDESFSPPGTGTKPDRWRVTTAIGTCHAMAGWDNSRHLLRLRAAGIVACFAYAASACIGEIRHFYRNGPGVSTIRLAQHTTDMKLVLNAHNYTRFMERSDVSRNQTYSHTSLLPLTAQIKLMRQASADFNTAGWGGSFGGSRWAETATQAAWLGRSIISFCEKPGRRRWERLQSRFNATLHCCHTHGKILTKWVDQNVLDLGSSAPGLCFVNAFAAQTVFDNSELGLLGDLRKAFRKEQDHG